MEEARNNHSKVPSRAAEAMSSGTHIKADEIELVVPFISSSHNSSTPAASFQNHQQPTILMSSSI
jgi:hypothetical protein